MTDFLKEYLPNILLIIANILAIILYYNQLKHVRKQLEDTQVIIKDSGDLRNAIIHELEGIWSLTGEFAIFQNDTSEHQSTGYLILTWLPNMKHYDIIYCYSVTKSGSQENIVTAICNGMSEGDISFKESATLSCILNILHRTDVERKCNYNSKFKMLLTANNDETSRINRLTSTFITPNTNGRLTFTKVN